MATKKTNSKSANTKKTTNVKKVATPNKKPLSKNKAKDEVEKLVDRLTLFDDTLMAKVFDKNIEATECILSIILNKKIKLPLLKDNITLKVLKLMDMMLRLIFTQLILKEKKLILKFKVNQMVLKLNEHDSIVVC